MSTRPPRGRQKARKEDAPTLPLKIVVRRLPPTLPETVFHTSIAAWHNAIDWSDYVPGKVSTSHAKSDQFSRSYLKFRKHADFADFAKRYQGHAFVNSEGHEYRASVETAPFQRIPRPLGNNSKAKDNLSGTIEQDPDYLAFLTSQKEVVPHEKEDILVSSKVTPLIEHLRAQKLKNEAKTKARKAKEAASKTKQLEEKRKAAQAQANATTLQMREKNAALSKTQVSSGKSKVNKDASNGKTDTPTSSKKSSRAARDRKHESDGKAAGASTGSNTKKSLVPTVPSNPSPLAQQRAPKHKTPNEAPVPRSADTKPPRPKRVRKKDAPKSQQHARGDVAVDISGPTPAEMAALAKAKT